MNPLPTLVKQFSNGHQALSVRINSKIDPHSIVTALKLPKSPRLFILSGGAGNMPGKTYARLTNLFAVLGQALAKKQCTIIDGGTQSGVMQLMGQALAQAHGTALHIGVVPAQANAGPNGIKAEDILDPNHSNFVLVDSDEWGGEVEAMYQLAAHLSAQAPSLAMLVNGGAISLYEIEKNVKQGREIVVIVGSGRLADEIAEAVRHPNHETRERIKEVVRYGRLILFDLETPPEQLVQILEQHLR